jgi:hypothetical protein
LQTIVLPYTEGGLNVRCPHCQHAILITPAQNAAAKSAQKSPLGRPRHDDFWFLKSEDGRDFGPVSKRELDQLFPELEIGQGTLAQGAPVNRYDISDLLPPIVGMPPPGMVVGIPVPDDEPEQDSTPRPMVRRLSEAIDPNVASSELYQETLEKLRQQRHGLHPLVVATAIIDFLFGTYTTIFAAYGFVFSLIRALSQEVWLEGSWELFLPLAPLAAIGYGLLVLRTAVGLLNYELWTIMSTYILSAISLAVSITLLVIPVWLVFPPILILMIGGILYAVLSTVAVSLPSVAKNFD